MPQQNPDDAANDEPKTYTDEAIGGDDSNDLNDIKDDLVDEDDIDPIHRSFEVSSNLPTRLFYFCIHFLKFPDFECLSTLLEKCFEEIRFNNGCEI